MGSQIRLVGPPTLVPSVMEELGNVTVVHDMDEGVRGANIVMMLRMQKERMESGLVPSMREYFRFYGLDRRRLRLAKENALVMHPGPMNRGVEIASDVADFRAKRHSGAG